MIILDTNVVSELMRSPGAGPVAAWIDAQPIEALAITSITVAEILRGIHRLPEGRRQRSLADAFRAFLTLGFGGSVLPFDAEAAEAYAAIETKRARLGRPIAAFDAMIAGIAVAHGADIATRDLGGFAECGVTIIDPWVTSPRT